MTALMYTCHLGRLPARSWPSSWAASGRVSTAARTTTSSCGSWSAPTGSRTSRGSSTTGAPTPTSTAGGDEAKPYAYLDPAGERSPSTCSARGIDADVQFAHLTGLHRIVHRVGASTTVDLVLAVDDSRRAADAAASWLPQPHPSWNVVLAAPAERGRPGPGRAAPPPGSPTTASPSIHRLRARATPPPSRHRRTPPAHADPRRRPHPRLADPPARLQRPTRHRRRRTRRSSPPTAASKRPASPSPRHPPSHHARGIAEHAPSVVTT